MSDEDYIDPGEDVKAYVASYLWLSKRDAGLADEMRAATLEYVSAEEWNAACEVLEDYARRKGEGPGVPDFASARVAA